MAARDRSEARPSGARGAPHVVPGLPLLRPPEGPEQGGFSRLKGVTISPSATPPTATAVGQTRPRVRVSDDACANTKAGLSARDATDPVFATNVHQVLAADLQASGS
jgi:hypothetical protein